MKCSKCSGRFIKKSGNTVIGHNVGVAFINTEYMQCDNCGQKVFGSKAWDDMGKKYKKVKNFF